jgi:hypothetical protein
LTLALLESQQKRNTRLFDGAFRALASSVPYGESDWPEMRRQEYVSWYAGGSSAAESAVTNCQPLKDAWRRGDEDQSSRLTLLFTMPIILRFYGYDSNMGLVDRMNLLVYSLTGLLKIQTDLPKSPKQMLDEYLELAKQFEFDEHAIPKPGGIVLHYWLEMDYLLSTALTALGKSSTFSMAGVKLPVPNLYEFALQGGELGSLDGNDLKSYFAMFDGVGNGFTTSMEVLRTLRSQEESEVKGRNA